MVPISYVNKKIINKNTLFKKGYLSIMRFFLVWYWFLAYEIKTFKYAGLLIMNHFI